MQGRHHRNNRISPDGSVRAHPHHGGGGGFYNSDYRNFSRGFGRGPPPPPPPPPPHKPNRRNGDVFMEAGKLAAEYLVSQGVLPPNVLQTKWQSGKDFRENQILDGRSRVGNNNVVTEARRRFSSDEFNSSVSGSRSHVRGKTRVESFMADSGPEYARSGSWWSEKSRTAFTDDIEGDDGLVSVQHYQHQQGGVGVGGGLNGAGETFNAISNESPSQNDHSLNSGTQFQKSYELPDEAGPNATNSSPAAKHFTPEGDHQVSNKSLDDEKILNVESQALKHFTINDEMDKQGAVEEDSSMRRPLMDGDGVSSNGNDLSQHSSLSSTTKESEDIPDLTVDEGISCGFPPSQELKVSAEAAPVEGSSSDILKHQIHDNKSFNSGFCGVQSFQSAEGVAVSDSACVTGRGESQRSESLPDSSILYEKALEQGHSELGKDSLVKDRGEKRAAQGHDIEERSKKPRETPSAMVGPDDYFRQHSFSGDPSHLTNKSIPPDGQVIEVPEEETLLDVAFFPRPGEESGIEFRGEKQLFPSSFKICDLNLMEASDISERHSNPVLNLSSVLDGKKEVPLDVDLTMSNSCNRFEDSEKNSGDDKENMVIEVEDALTEEEEIFDTSERKTDNVNSSMENFPTQMESTGDLPDAQDGYGLMISELLGADIPNCSPVSADISGLPTEMGLHNEADIIAHDDQLYLAMSDIPISFLEVWEQPNQHYDKPF